MQTDAFDSSLLWTGTSGASTRFVHSAKLIASRTEVLAAAGTDMWVIHNEFGDSLWVLVIHRVNCVATRHHNCSTTSHEAQSERLSLGTSSKLVSVPQRGPSQVNTHLGDGCHRHHSAACDIVGCVHFSIGHRSRVVRCCQAL